MVATDLVEAERETRLNDILAAHFDTVEAGQADDRETLLARHPDLAAELTAFFEEQDQVFGLASPLRALLQAEQVGVPRAGSAPSNEGGAWPLSSGDPGQSFGDYELLEQIGAGGMGVVYRAKQKSLGRFVALKLIRASSLASSAELQRFRAEAEAVASLDHPHIVPIYEVGEHDGQPYFSMKLFEGGNLAQRAARGEGQGASKEGQRRAAEMVSTVARAVRHAHERGLLHRDLKPSNILLDAEGQPHVADFGLAKWVERDSSLTQSGVLVGTPSYMAPEQAEPREGRAVRCVATTATDVYALGAILYTLLTGRPPFRGETLLDTLAQVKDCEPVAPRRVNPRTDRDLEAVCLKCLEKEPVQRYATAAELADDLDAFLHDRPVRAQRPAFWQRAGKWSRRHATSLRVVAATLFLALLVGAVLLWREQRNTRAALEVAKQQSALAEEQRALLRQRLYPAEISRAHRLWKLGNLDEMAAALAQFEPAPGEEDLRGFEWHFLKRLVLQSQVKAKLTYQGHAGDVYWATFAPDGKTVASAGKDGSIQLWDPATGILLKLLQGHASEVNGLHFSPDGRTLASTSDDETIRLWDLKNLPACAVLSGHKGEVGTAIFSPDGTTLVSGGEDGIIRIWDTATRTILRQWDAHEQRINIVVFSPDGQTLASCANDGLAKVWDAHSGRLRHLLNVGQPVHCIMFSPDGRLLATTDWLGRIHLWDSANGSLVRDWDAHDGQKAYPCQFSADGRYLLTGNDRGLVRFWSIADGTVLHQFQAHSDRVWCAQLSPDGNTIVTAGRDGEVKTWELPELGLSRSVGRYAVPVHDVAFSPTGTKLAITSDHVELWDLVHPSRSPTLVLPGGPFRFAPNDENLAVVAQGGVLAQVDLNSGMVRALRSPPEGLSSLAFALSPEQNQVASYDFDGALRLWNSATGRQQLWGKLKPGVGQSFLLAGARPSSFLVAGGTAVSLWEGDQPPHVIEQAFPGRIEAAASSPDGQLLALGGLAGHLHLLDTHTGRKVAQLFGHTQGVGGLAFSPDGRTLASASWDGTVRLWQVATRQELFTLEARPERLNSVAFSADGKLLATAGDPTKEGDAVRLWSVGREENR